MTALGGIRPDDGLTDVLTAFPKNAGPLLRLLNRIMCDEGVLTRGEREAIATLTTTI